MTQRNRHLLEAFKASGAINSGAPTPAQAPTSASPGAVGGPAPSPSPTRVSLTDTRPVRSVVLLRSQVQLIGVVVLLAIACAFLLGRASVRIASASGASPESKENSAALGQTPAVQQPASQPASSTPPPNSARAPDSDVDRTPRTPAELALVDPKNVWTVKLVDYKNTDYEKRLALDTFNYVTQQGLQACIVPTTAHIYVVVGAAPAQVDLDTLLQRCKTMPGPPPKSKAGEFQSAYLEKIERIFPRNK